MIANALRQLCALLLLGCCVSFARSEAPLDVAAAASLTDVMQALSDAWVNATPGATAPRFNFASSAMLARQIEAGAKTDLFVSADQEWMDYLADRRLIRADTRRDLVGNRLVLIAPATSTITLRVGQGFTLRAALGDGKLALADPDYVPAGKYARMALMSLGVWNDVADRLVRAENVRVALMIVSRGEAPLGIVYATDARADARVRVLDTFPQETHLPIRYPAAATTTAGPQAAAFLRFLESRAGMTLFAAAGFIPLEPTD